MKKFAAATAALLIAAIPASVFAQNYSLPANFGEIYLNSGFTPDPYVVDVIAGGNINAANIGGSCRGMISDAPDFQITYSAGSFPLAIRTRSGADTTLVVNAPDGRWYCDDDSFGNLNAQVYFSNPQSGVYDVWVGTYSGGTAQADLIITELP